MSPVSRQQITAIHTLKSRAGLDDDAYRDLLSGFGATSSKQLDQAKAGALIERLKVISGGREGAPTAGLTGPYAKKLQALWISGWQLGVVRDRRDSAMLAFIQRQTGIEHTRFLRQAADARKAVEALKSWLARAAGVDWSAHDDPQDAVVAAQLRLLDREGERFVLSGPDLMQDLGMLVRRHVKAGRK